MNHTENFMQPGLEQPAMAAHNSKMDMFAPVAEIQKAIAQRAYALYEARGCEPGHDLDDWLCAEEQVLGLQHTKVSDVRH